MDKQKYDSAVREKSCGFIPPPLQEKCSFGILHVASFALAALAGTMAFAGDVVGVMSVGAGTNGANKGGLR